MESHLPIADIKEILALLSRHVKVGANDSVHSVILNFAEQFPKELSQNASELLSKKKRKKKKPQSVSSGYTPFFEYDPETYRGYVRSMVAISQTNVPSIPISFRPLPPHYTTNGNYSTLPQPITTFDPSVPVAVQQTVQQSIVALWIRTGNNTIRRATGFAITPQHVVTAKHSFAHKNPTTDRFRVYGALLDIATMKTGPIQYELVIQHVAAQAEEDIVVLNVTNGPPLIQLTVSNRVLPRISELVWSVGYPLEPFFAHDPIPVGSLMAADYPAQHHDYSGAIHIQSTHVKAVAPTAFCVSNNIFHGESGGSVLDSNESHQFSIVVKN
jgi:hypothetical protein